MHPTPNTQHPTQVALVAAVFSLFVSVEAIAAATVSDCAGTNNFGNSSATCPTNGSGRRVCDLVPGTSDELACVVTQECDDSTHGAKAWLVDNTATGGAVDYDYTFFVQCENGAKTICCDIEDNGTQDLLKLGIEGTSKRDWLFLRVDPAQFGGGGGVNSLQPVNGYSSISAGLKGGDGDDFLDGSNETSVTDYLDGGTGEDDIRGLAGVDNITGGSGIDFIYTGSGNDSILGYGEDDSIVGGNNGDTISGGGGDDIICGEEMDNFSGPADFFAFPTDDPSTYTFECIDDAPSGVDTINGDDGNDQIWGHGGNDILSGDAGADDLYGGSNDDTLEGGAGLDSLFGEGDQDTICDPGTTTDYIEGGSGNDLIGVESDTSFTGTIYGGTSGSPGLGSDQCLPQPSCPSCAAYSGCDSLWSSPTCSY